MTTKEKRLFLESSNGIFGIKQNSGVRVLAYGKLERLWNADKTNKIQEEK
jgi:hypothetical protein